MNVIVSLLVSHLITSIEAALVAEEPALLQELELLVTKLQNYIEKKSPAMAVVASPALAVVNSSLAAISPYVAPVANPINNLDAGM